jgi:hypothetical protein
MVLRRVIPLLGLAVVVTASSGCFHRRWARRHEACCTPCASSCCESAAYPPAISVTPAPPLAGPGPLTPVPARAIAPVYEGR